MSSKLVTTLMSQYPAIVRDILDPCALSNAKYPDSHRYIIATVLLPDGRKTYIRADCMRGALIGGNARLEIALHDNHKRLTMGSILVSRISAPLQAPRPRKLEDMPPRQLRFQSHPLTISPRCSKSRTSVPASKSTTSSHTDASGWQRCCSTPSRGYSTCTGLPAARRLHGWCRNFSAGSEAHLKSPTRSR
ncbi:hypothetical protein BC628DRAFT_669997 [Trametes gibbosa]|nr:hypothetical protein BC628DRAFT_669997 [Trametes gibbosa]